MMLLLLLLLLYVFLLILALDFFSRTDWAATQGQTFLIPSLLSGMNARCLMWETNLARKAT